VHHFKVPGRDMADVALQHLLLSQLLAFVLVVVVLVKHPTAAADGFNLLFFLNNRSRQMPCLTSSSPWMMETWMCRC
jgi:hypothetical protein